MPRLNRFQFRAESAQGSLSAEAQKDGSIRVGAYIGGSGVVFVVPETDADNLGKFIIETGIDYRAALAGGEQ